MNEKDAPSTPRRTFLAGGLALAGTAMAQPNAEADPPELKVAIIVA